MTLNIDVERMMRETQAHLPLEGQALLPFLRRPNLSASFSKDILLVGGEVAVYCHLSIGQPRNINGALGEVLNQFTAKLGQPDVTANTYPTWTIGGKLYPMVVHHFLWKTTEEPSAFQTRSL